MGSGLSQKYNNTYGSMPGENGANEVREDTAEYATGRRILRESSGTSNINDNVSHMTGKFAPNEHGNFGQPGKNTRIMKCDDPVSDSAMFYEQIGKG